MSDWARKRFWTEVTVEDSPEGFAIRLDGRAVKSPAKATLILPTRALAELVAAEWAAQENEIKPDTMPATRAANAALDKVSGQFDEVAALLTAYGETDLLCYRAEGPGALVDRQRVAWDPLLEWSAGRFGVSWEVTTGVMPAPQPAGTLERLGQHVAGFTAFELTGFHDLVAISGSLVIGLAVTEGIASVDDLWSASRIDEDWQIAQWGEDAHAAKKAAAHRASFFDAARFFAACRGSR